MANYYDSRNEYDGFDGKNSVQPYDDKKEKHFQADIWILLACLSFLIFTGSCYKHIKEVQLIHNGVCIEAEFHASTFTATYFDENGKYHGFDISGFIPVVDGDMIKLYYMEDIAEARPANTGTSWLGIHLIFIALFVLSVWRIAAVYRKKSYI